MGARLSVRNSSTRHRYTVFVDTAPLLVGRASTSDIRLPFGVVSSRHLRLGRDDAGLWTIEELGSTNGTTINGQQLEPGPPRRLSTGDELEIGDVSISFTDDAEQNSGDFTLAQTGTLARKLVADALSFEDDDESAFIESVEGPSQGLRKMIADDIDELTIGSSPDAWLTLPDLCETAATIVRSGDGFAVQIEGIDEVPRALSSRDRIELGENALVFFDPLESVLTEQSSRASETVTAEPIQPTSSDEQSSRASETVTAEPIQPTSSDEIDPLAANEREPSEEAAPAHIENGRAMGTAEWALVGFAGLLAIGGIVIILVLFDLL